MSNWEDLLEPEDRTLLEKYRETYRVAYADDESFHLKRRETKDSWDFKQDIEDVSDDSVAVAYLYLEAELSSYPFEFDSVLDEEI